MFILSPFNQINFHTIHNCDNNDNLTISLLINQYFYFQIRNFFQIYFFYNYFFSNLYFFNNISYNYITKFAIVFKSCHTQLATNHLYFLYQLHHNNKRCYAIASNIYKTSNISIESIMYILLKMLTNYHSSIIILI